MNALQLEKTKNYLLIILISLFILYLGRTLFIPLSFALFISFILYPICKKLEQYRIPRPVAVLICILFLLMAGFLVTLLLFHQLSGFSHQWLHIKKNIPAVIDQFHELLISIGISTGFQEKIIQTLKENSSVTLFPIIKSFLYSSGETLIFIILIPLFVALLLLNRSTLLAVLNDYFRSFPNETIQRILHLVVKTYYNFIKGMVIVYLIVGILNSVGLWIIGIPNPVFFGFVASILTFVPFIGIIVGSLLPISIAWITYNSVWYPLGIILVFTIVQYLEANIIFPLAVSSRLNISALATIISIIVGGIIWGAAGMILFVPFVAIIKLIADNFPELKLLSMLLGKQKG